MAQEAKLLARNHKTTVASVGLETRFMKRALIAAVLGVSWAASASAQQITLSCKGTFISFSKEAGPLSSSIPPTSATIDLDRKTFTFMAGTWSIDTVKPDSFFVKGSSESEHIVSQGRIDRTTGTTNIWTARGEDLNKSTGMPSHLSSEWDLSCTPAKPLF
jgi:hypothetical protein